MTPHIENSFTWQRFVSTAMPPRDPYDDDDEDDEEDDKTDEEREPPVIREPDEDE